MRTLFCPYMWGTGKRTAAIGQRITARIPWKQLMWHLKLIKRVSVSVSDALTLITHRKKTKKNDDKERQREKEIEKEIERKKNLGESIFTGETTSKHLLLRGRVRFDERPAVTLVPPLFLHIFSVFLIHISSVYVRLSMHGCNQFNLIAKSLLGMGIFK